MASEDENWTTENTEHVWSKPICRRDKQERYALWKSGWLILSLFIYYFIHLLTKFFRQLLIPQL
jgi:hypothetical protein